MKKSENKYTPKGIVFIPTYNCTAMCRHCNNDFLGHDLTEKMDIEKAVEIVAESKKYGLNSIQITGGEITMYPEFMPAIVKKARSMAIRLSKPPTNCYIAKNKEDTEHFFEELKRSGYTSGFRISIDPYHNGKIPIKTVAKFVYLYGKHFKLSSLTIGSCHHDMKKIFSLYDEFTEELKHLGLKNAEYRTDEKRFYLDGQKVKYGIWLPTRPSWKSLKDEEVAMKSIKQTNACLGPDGLAYLWIEPDFRVRACSCNGNGFLDFFIIGDLSKESISDVVKRARNNRVIGVLAEKGASGLRDIINKDGIVMEESKKYSFMCELCNEILGSKKLKELLTKNLDV